MSTRGAGAPVRVPATRGRLGGVVLLALLMLPPLPALARSHDDEYRVTIFPTHPILGSREWISFGYLGYVGSPDQQIETGYLGSGAIWKFAPWAEAWFGLIGTHTDADAGPDSDELRPLVGFKAAAVLPNKTSLFTFSRLEYRILEKDGSPDREYFRFRERLGTEFPFGRRPFELHTWYGLADFEGFYRFDSNRLDQTRLRGGVGLVAHDRVRAEFIYHMQLTSADSGDGLEWTGNIYRLNFKVAFKKGLLARLGQFDFDAD